MPLILDPDDLADVTRLRDLREQNSLARKEEAEIRERLLIRLGSEDQALTSAGSPALHVQHQIRRAVNSKKLEALYPDVYDQVVEEKPVTVLKIDLDAFDFPLVDARVFGAAADEPF